MKKYKISDIRKASKQIDAAWTVLVVDPVAIRLVWFFSNFTRITPNQITIISFVFGLASAFSFLQGTWFYLILGAILFEISFLFDCVDGKLARLKRLKSGFGLYLDAMLDQTRIFLVATCLVYGQYLLTKDASYLLFGLLYIFLYLFHFTGEHKFYVIKKEFYKKDVNTNNMFHSLQKHSFIWKIKTYLNSKRVAVVPTFVEADTLAFFILPLLMKVKLGLLLGSFVLFVNTLIEAFVFFLIKHPK